MCGLFGVIGRTGFEKGLAAAVRDLGFMSALRGIDSTGVCAVDIKRREYHLHKYPAPAFDFLRTKKADDIVMRANETAAFLGHTRAASTMSGAPSIETAHPFVLSGAAGSIVGMHNGYISNWPQNSREFLVDSEWALKQIADKGTAALSEFDGSFALVWYDFDKKQVFVARNGGRTLYGAKLDSGKVMFASEHGMIFGAALRNDIPIKQINAFEPFHLYTFDGESGNLVSNDKFEPFVPAPYLYQSKSTWPAPAASDAAKVVSEVKFDKDDFVINHCLVHVSDSSGRGADLLRKTKHVIGEVLEVYLDSWTVGRPSTGITALATGVTSGNGFIPIRLRAVTAVCADFLKLHWDTKQPINVVVRGSVQVYTTDDGTETGLVCSVTSDQANEFDRLSRELEKAQVTSSAPLVEAEVESGNVYGFD